jgi:hypothetical protein
MNQLVTIPSSNAEVYRASTDAAGLCRDIVLRTAQNIQGRKYVKVEGWQAIAIAHGCVASADNVERLDEEHSPGFRAIGTIRRMSDGAEIARAEGFVGDDEPMWAKRPVYARRAMAQTRAISRACRSAFAHVVVLIDADLSTTPAEEVPFEGFDEAPRETAQNRTAKTASAKTAAAPKPEARATVLGWQDLDNEMDRCRTKTALTAWNKMRELDIKALPKARFDALGAKFNDLLDTLPNEAEPAGFDLKDDEIPEFA